MYFSLRFGLVNMIVSYLRLERYVVTERFFNLKCVKLEITVLPNSV